MSEGEQEEAEGREENREMHFGGQFAAGENDFNSVLSWFFLLGRRIAYRLVGMGKFGRGKHLKAKVSRSTGGLRTKKEASR